MASSSGTSSAADAGPASVENFHVVKEGKASILFGKKNEVFYNKAQVVNRDLSIACIKIYDEMRREAIAERARKRREAKAAGSASAAPAPAPADGEAKEEAKAEADPEGGAMEEEPPEVKDDPAEAERERQEDERRAAEDEAALGGVDPGSVPGLRILEALSATGLRAIRYWKEIDGLRQIVANDKDPNAAAAIRRNVVHNGICPDTQVVPHVGDAVNVMMESRERAKQFDVVDLDPYGTASPFLDGAVQAVSEDGLLCVTCTDMAVLCGNHPETCFAKYGAVPLKAKYSHEMALRMVAFAVQSAAARAGRYAHPLASFSIDFYVRLFFRVKTSRLMCGEAMSQSGMVYQCCGCDAFHIQPLGVTKPGNNPSNPKRQVAQGPPVDQKCGECGRPFHVGGPVWTGALHDTDFVARLLAHFEAAEAKERYAAHQRIRGLAVSLAEELPDVPLFYSLNQIGKVLHCQVPARFKLTNALESLGYKASGSHANPTALKTNAPPSAFYNVLRWWLQKNPNKPQPEGSVAAAILAKPATRASARPPAPAHRAQGADARLALQEAVPDAGGAAGGPPRPPRRPLTARRSRRRCRATCRPQSPTGGPRRAPAASGRGRRRRARRARRRPRTGSRSAGGRSAATTRRRASARTATSASLYTTKGPGEAQRHPMRGPQGTHRRHSQFSLVYDRALVEWENAKH